MTHCWFCFNPIWPIRLESFDRLSPDTRPIATDVSTRDSTGPPIRQLHFVWLSKSLRQTCTHQMDELHVYTTSSCPMPVNVSFLEQRYINPCDSSDIKNRKWENKSMNHRTMRAPNQPNDVSCTNAIANVRARSYIHSFVGFSPRVAMIRCATSKRSIDVECNRWLPHIYSIFISLSSMWCIPRFSDVNVRGRFSCTRKQPIYPAHIKYLETYVRIFCVCFDFVIVRGDFFSRIYIGVRLR